MEFCDKLCCLCDEQGVNPVNYAGYHRFCLNPEHLSSRNDNITCRHCNSNVTIMSLLEKFICTHCGSNYRKQSFACGHGICSFCKIYQCPRCQQECCGLCNNPQQNSCDNCLQNYCNYCASFKEYCLSCGGFCCACDGEEPYCRECQDKICKNCESIGVEEVMLECGHSGCRKCLVNQRCEACRRLQLTSNSIIFRGIEESAKILPRKAEFVYDRSNSVEFRDNTLSEKLFAGYCTVSSANLCESCSERNKPLSTLPCTHKVCEVCSGEKSCKACERDSNIRIRNNLEAERKRFKESCSEIDNVKYPTVEACESCNRNNTMLKLGSCNHALCGNCASKTNCLKCEIINHLCDRCNSRECNSRKLCGHRFCSVCIHQECPKCTAEKPKKKCCSCQGKSTNYMKLDCNHHQCFECEVKCSVCNKCRKFECKRCLKQCSKLEYKNCGHNLCIECYKEEADNIKCRLCRVTVCPMCKEKGHMEKVFICGHSGCEYCFSPEVRCYTCVFSKTKLKQGETSIDAYYETRNCFACKQIFDCKRLMCGDFICRKCVYKCKVKYLNYLCVDCCLMKEKVCIDCEKNCIWQTNQKELHKICCNKYFCRFCFRKRTRIGRLCRDCNCNSKSADDFGIFSAIN